VLPFAIMLHFGNTPYLLDAMMLLPMMILVNCSMLSS